MTFRQHLTTLVAVFVALAVGVVLGGGLLSDVTEAASQPVGAQADDATPQAAYTDSFTGAVAPALVAGRLADRSVALVDRARRRRAGRDVAHRAGHRRRGAVSGRYDLTATMVGPDQKTLVDTLGSQLMTQQKDAIAAEATTYDRIGQLLGLAVATGTPEGESTNGKGRAILESLTGADLLPRPARWSAGPRSCWWSSGTSPPPRAATRSWRACVTGLSGPRPASWSSGTPPTAARASSGACARSPCPPQVATVDGVETAAGQVTTVLALARAIETDGGAFGASGADGPVPLG